MELKIATATSRRAEIWNNKVVTWDRLADRLSKPKKINYTQKQYGAFPKTKKAEIKDVGGYVAGPLIGGVRKKSSIESRSLITLDIDYANAKLIETLKENSRYELVVHTTMSHTQKEPRYRIIIPLTREVSVEAYEPIARKVADELVGIELCDDSTFQAERLMYYPAVASDADFGYARINGEMVDPDRILNAYTDWKNITSWPRSARVDEIVRTQIDKQADPLEKPGLIGAFCRAYTVTEVLEEFLDKYYSPEVGDRYTYKYGTSSSGAIVYEDKFLYSHHATDPASEKLCNAFDLVRIHKYGEHDVNALPNTPVNRLPSFKAMCDDISQDEYVKAELLDIQVDYDEDDFEDVEIYEDKTEEEIAEIQKKTKKEKNAWLAKLAVNNKGTINNTTDNIKIVLQNDPKLEGLIATNQLSNQAHILRKTVWNRQQASSQLSDVDMAGLRWYLELKYNLTKERAIKDAVKLVAEQNGYHPVKDYLESLEWDGVERADTVVIDYLGADDTIYVREATRKSLLACIARIYKPGTKYDHVLTLQGEQGDGKSALLSRLGGEWYSENVSFLKIDKDLLGHIHMNWILEIGEMAGFRKAEQAAIKNFISRTEDTFRPAFGETIGTHKRQFVFFATVNDQHFLQDPTGNRRWLPIKCNRERMAQPVLTALTKDTVDQIWAELYQAHLDDESLLLSSEAYELAKEQQKEHTEFDPLEQEIENYLAKLEPENYKDMDLTERIIYFNDYDEEIAEGKPKQFVCAKQIWQECLGNHGNMSVRDSRRINNVLTRLKSFKQSKPKRMHLYGTQRVFERKEDLEIKRKIYEETV